MKAIKGLGLFFGIAIVISACFTPPEFALEPVITLDDIYLGQQPEAVDSLVISLAFKDGDGNLGFAANTQSNEADFAYPFHKYNFHVLDGDNIVEIASKQPIYDMQRLFYQVDNLGKPGKLITKKMVEKKSLSEVPAYFSGSCSYRVDNVFVDLDDDEMLDKTMQNIVDTVAYYNTVTDVTYVLAIVSDTFYISHNINHNNIFIEFWKQPTTGGALEKVDFQTGCIEPFDARFPVLSNKEEGTPLEGVLSYTLYSNAIRQELEFNYFKLKIKIQDRSLNVSNVIETDMYSIDELSRR